MKYLIELTLCGTLVCMGCGVGATTSPVPIAQYNRQVRDAKVISKQIDRGEFKALLSHAAPQQTVRIVELLYGRDTSPGHKEYRVFGIEKGSAFHLLGLENADVVVAANGYVLHSVDKLPRFVELLADEESGSIDLRREGKAIRYQYTFE